MKRHRQVVAIMVAVLTLLVGAWIAPRTVAQDEDAAGFPLPALAMVCETHPTEWPFRNGGCVPVTITVTFETEDGSFSASCATDQYGERTGGCTVDVPFSSTVIAAADTSGFPAGYVLTSDNPQSFDIPDGPPDGVFGGPVFIALPVMGDEPAPPAEEEPINEEPSGEEPASVTQLPTTGTGPTLTPGTDFLPKALSAALLFAIAIALHLNMDRSSPRPNRGCAARTRPH